MENLGTIYAEYGLRFDPFLQAVQNIKARTSEFLTEQKANWNRMADDYSAGLEKMKKGSAAAYMEISAQTQKMGMCWSIGVTAPIMAAVGASLKFAASIETQKTAFGVLLGDMDKGAAVFARLNEQAAKTPLKLQEITRGGQVLLATGTNASDLTDRLQMLGDVAMGDSEKFNRLVDAYAKLQSKGKASMEELNRFSENGVNIVGEMATMLGKTTEEIYKMSSQSKLGFGDVTAALTRMTSEGGSFYKMMDRASQLVNGKVSTALDNMRLAGAKLVEQYTPFITSFLDGVINIADKITNLDSTSKALFAGLAASLAVGGPILMGMSALIKAWAALNAGMLANPAIAVVAGVAALASAIVGLGVAAAATSDKYKEYQTQLSAAAMSYGDQATKLDGLLTKYEALRKSAVTNKTAQEDLKKVVADILALVPSAAGGWDSLTGSITINTAEVRRAVEENLAAEKMLKERLQRNKEDQLLVLHVTPDDTRKANILRANDMSAVEATLHKSQLQDLQEQLQDTLNKISLTAKDRSDQIAKAKDKTVNAIASMYGWFDKRGNIQAKFLADYTGLVANMKNAPLAAVFDGMYKRLDEVIAGGGSSLSKAEKELLSRVGQAEVLVAEIASLGTQIKLLDTQMQTYAKGGSLPGSKGGSGGDGSTEGEDPQVKAVKKRITAFKDAQAAIKNESYDTQIALLKTWAGEWQKLNKEMAGNADALELIASAAADSNASIKELFRSQTFDAIDKSIKGLEGLSMPERRKQLEALMANLSSAKAAEPMISVKGTGTEASRDALAWASKETQLTDLMKALGKSEEEFNRNLLKYNYETAESWDAKKAALGAYLVALEIARAKEADETQIQAYTQQIDALKKEGQLLDTNAAKAAYKNKVVTAGVDEARVAGQAYIKTLEDLLKVLVPDSQAYLDVTAEIKNVTKEMEDLGKTAADKRAEAALKTIRDMETQMNNEVSAASRRSRDDQVSVLKTWADKWASFRSTVLDSVEALKEVDKIGLQLNTNFKDLSAAGAIEAMNKALEGLDTVSPTDRPAKIGAIRAALQAAMGSEMSFTYSGGVQTGATADLELYKSALEQLTTAEKQSMGSARDWSVTRTKLAYDLATSVQSQAQAFDAYIGALEAAAAAETDYGKKQGYLDQITEARATAARKAQSLEIDVARRTYETAVGYDAQQKALDAYIKTLEAAAALEPDETQRTALTRQAEDLKRTYSELGRVMAKNAYEIAAIDEDYDRARGAADAYLAVLREYAKTLPQNSAEYRATAEEIHGVTKALEEMQDKAKKKIEEPQTKKARQEAQNMRQDFSGLNGKGFDTQMAVIEKWAKTWQDLKADMVGNADAMEIVRDAAQTIDTTLRNTFRDQLFEDIDNVTSGLQNLAAADRMPALQAALQKIRAAMGQEKGFDLTEGITTEASSDTQIYAKKIKALEELIKSLGKTEAETALAVTRYVYQSAEGYDAKRTAINTLLEALKKARDVELDETRKLALQSEIDALLKEGRGLDANTAKYQFYASIRGTSLEDAIQKGQTYLLALEAEGALLAAGTEEAEANAQAVKQQKIAVESLQATLKLNQLGINYSGLGNQKNARAFNKEIDDYIAKIQELAKASKSTTELTIFQDAITQLQDLKQSTTTTFPEIQAKIKANQAAIDLWSKKRGTGTAEEQATAEKKLNDLLKERLALLSEEEALKTTILNALKGLAVGIAGLISAAMQSSMDAAITYAQARVGNLNDQYDRLEAQKSGATGAELTAIMKDQVALTRQRLELEQEITDLQNEQAKTNEELVTGLVDQFLAAAVPIATAFNPVAGAIAGVIQLLWEVGKALWGGLTDQEKQFIKQAQDDVADLNEQVGNTIAEMAGVGLTYGTATAEVIYKTVNAGGLSGLFGATKQVVDEEATAASEAAAQAVQDANQKILDTFNKQWDALGSALENVVKDRKLNFSDFNQNLEEALKDQLFQAIFVAGKYADKMVAVQQMMTAALEDGVITEEEMAAIRDYYKNQIVDPLSAAFEAAADAIDEGGLSQSIEDLAQSVTSAASDVLTSGGSWADFKNNVRDMMLSQITQAILETEAMSAMQAQLAKMIVEASLDGYTADEAQSIEEYAKSLWEQLQALYAQAVQGLAGIFPSDVSATVTTNAVQVSKFSSEDRAVLVELLRPLSTLDRLPGILSDEVLKINQTFAQANIAALTAQSILIEQVILENSGGINIIAPEGSNVQDMIEQAVDAAVSMRMGRGG